MNVGVPIQHMRRLRVSCNVTVEHHFHHDVICNDFVGAIFDTLVIFLQVLPLFCFGSLSVPQKLLHRFHKSWVRVHVSHGRDGNHILLAET